MAEKDGVSRRGFLKTAVTVGAALTMAPALGKVRMATEEVARMRQAGRPQGVQVTARRTLGTGQAAFEVSALGLGLMGMTYNRSWHPDKQQCIRLIAEAVE